MKAIDRKARNQGMNWIRPEKRLAIYLRDGLACSYCDATVEETARLTLDHIVPHSKGGSNDATNLVTCCLECNSTRGARPLSLFVCRSVRETVIRRAQEVLDVNMARKLIAKRGGFSAALSAAA
jgi:5-methylcytosine-specific restriction endonuclease McrA